MPTNCSCRSIFILLLGLTVPTAAGERIAPEKARADGDVFWYDLRLLPVEGQGWTETKAPYDRLPAKADGVVRAPVWSLSRNSAGLCARFVTDAMTIQAKWTLTSDQLAMNHMAATGVSGLDLYVRTEDSRWRWLAVGRPDKQTNQATLVSSLPAGQREYLLYLPLYNGVSSVEIGLPKGAFLEKPGSWAKGHDKPIVFYGTSITQGGCASRPGMVHTAILQRRLNWPVINLGFSGNGQLDPELGTLMAELDPAVYVLDCLPNLQGNQVAERIEPFVQTLRKAHPETPILLVEDRSYTDSFLIASKKKRNEESRAALKAAYERMTSEGVKNLYYLDGESLLAADGEGTVDSSHPTDLGFVQHADAFEKVLRTILK